MMFDLKQRAAPLVRILDDTMPGRRLGSTPPEDCKPAALAALHRLRDLLPDHLALSTVRAFLELHGERHDEVFAVAFRREAILKCLREATR